LELSLSRCSRHRHLGVVAALGQGRRSRSRLPSPTLQSEATAKLLVAIADAPGRGRRSRPRLPSLTLQASAAAKLLVAVADALGRGHRSKPRLPSPTLKAVPVAELLRADARVAALLGVPGLGSHTNDTIPTLRLYWLEHAFREKS
jgi:hypothetical protein